MGREEAQGLSQQARALAQAVARYRGGAAERQPELDQEFEGLPDIGPAEIDVDDRLDHLRARLVVTEAALHSEREHRLELLAKLDEMNTLKHLLDMEKERTEALRRERDGWKVRAQKLAEPLFQQFD